MASNIKASTALFLCISLLFFALVSSHPTTYSKNPIFVHPGVTNPARCNLLNLGVCANLLGLVKVEIGNVPTQPYCCSLIQGLVDLEAAVCLCTAIKANVLGINLKLPIDLSVVLNNCGRRPSDQYICSA